MHRLFHDHTEGGNLVYATLPPLNPACSSQGFTSKAPLSLFSITLLKILLVVYYDKNSEKPLANLKYKYKQNLFKICSHYAKQPV